MKGKSVICIGLQYGDEGKGKIIDKLVEEENTKVIARFNGGANAGHTCETEDYKIAFHAVPSGVGRPDLDLYIGSGCVLNPIKLIVEIENIESVGLKIKDRLFIAGNTPLVQPHHVLIDEITGKKVGTTGNGIGPAYADLANRQFGDIIKNIRLGDYLSNPDEFKKHVIANLEDATKRFDAKINILEKVKEFDDAVKLLKRYLVNDPLFLVKKVEAGENVFFEGANAALLDANSGTVPFVTSSRTVAGNAYVGGDLSLKTHKKTIGVAKAIMSRVGNGPFVSEFGGMESEEYCGSEGGYKYTEKVEKEKYDVEKFLKSKNPFELGIALRMIGGEYGATTKRPRRIGAFDLVQLKQTCLLNGIDELFITKFDCLIDFAKTSLPGIPLVTAYELDGKEIDYVPQTVKELRRTKPIVTYMPFIKTDIRNIRKSTDLPKEVVNLVNFIEKFMGIKVGGIGVGPRREELIRY